MKVNYDLVSEIATRNGSKYQSSAWVERIKTNVLWNIIAEYPRIDDRIDAIEEIRMGFAISKYYIPFSEAFYNYKVGDYLDGHMLISSKRRNEGRNRPYVYYVKLI
jgi:hypothetical protein